MRGIRFVEVKKRAGLMENKTFVLNLMSSPGAGETIVILIPQAGPSLTYTGKFFILPSSEYLTAQMEKTAIRCR